MRYLLSAIVVAILVSGCAATKAPFQLPVDTHHTVRINKQFDSLANATRINFQGGERVAEKKLDRWTTYCRLYVYNRHREADYVTSVAPGDFEIFQVFIRYDSANGLDRPWSYASFRWMRYDPPAFYLYKVGMQLTSPDQADVKSLNCYKKWATRGRYYPTLTEMREALGDLIEIRPGSTSN